jgi:ribosomal protein S18 acetylase RimI-like enzyme
MAEIKTKQEVISQMNEIEESNSLFQDVWSMYARGAGGEVVERPGFVATWAGVQWPIVNVVFLNKPVPTVDDLEDTLKRINDFVATKQQPGMLIACDDWLPDGKDQFAEHGWIQISQAYGMVAEKCSTDSSEGDLEYRKIDSQELRCAVADLNAAGYEIPSEMAREALDHSALWGEGCFGYVGFLNDTPVATASTYVRSNCLYVALVATRPDFRQRGLARKITSHSVEQAHAASGLQRTLLHATPMARSIYESLGFRTVTTFPMFLPAALLAAAPQ